LSDRIEIKHKDDFTDGREKSLTHMIFEDIKIKIDKIKIIDVYNLFGDYSKDELEILKDKLFHDPVYQTARNGFYYAKEEDFDYLIEISYLPGVTDNIGRTSARGIEYLLGKKVDDNDVRSSKLYLFKTNFDKNIIINIVKNILCNELIENYIILSKKDVLNGYEINYSKPEQKVINPPYYNIIDLDVPDEN